MKIQTNRHWVNFLYGYELTEAEKADFDYVDDIESHNFIRYRGAVIDPSEVFPITDTMRLHGDFKDWQGYQSDSYFSGIVIKYSDDFEQYQIGTFIN
jgi:hypothetical protein